MVRRDIFAWRGVGTIIRPRRQAKCDRREIRRLNFGAVARTRNEPHDFRGQDTASHTTIAIRNTSASEIRYAVIHDASFSMEKMRGRSRVTRDHFGREPYPLGAWGPPARALPRAARQRRSRALAIFGRFGQTGPDDDALANDARVWMVAAYSRARRRPISGNERGRRRRRPRAIEILK